MFVFALINETDRHIDGQRHYLIEGFPFRLIYQDHFEAVNFLQYAPLAKNNNDIKVYFYSTFYRRIAGKSASHN